jgi:hypothetical protein
VLSAYQGKKASNTVKGRNTVLGQTLFETYGGARDCLAKKNRDNRTASRAQANLLLLLRTKARMQALREPERREVPPKETSCKGAEGV